MLPEEGSLTWWNMLTDLKQSLHYERPVRSAPSSNALPFLWEREWCHSASTLECSTQTWQETIRRRQLVNNHQALPLEYSRDTTLAPKHLQHDVLFNNTHFGDGAECDSSAPSSVSNKLRGASTERLHQTRWASTNHHGNRGGHASAWHSPPGHWKRLRFIIKSKNIYNMHSYKSHPWKKGLTSGVPLRVTNWWILQRLS